MSRLFVPWLDVIEIIHEIIHVGCFVGSCLGNVPQKFLKVLDASVPSISYCSAYGILNCYTYSNFSFHSIKGVSTFFFTFCVQFVILKYTSFEIIIFIRHFSPCGFWVCSPHFSPCGFWVCSPRTHRFFIVSIARNAIPNQQKTETARQINVFEGQRMLCKPPSYANYRNFNFKPHSYANYRNFNLNHRINIQET